MSNDKTVQQATAEVWAEYHAKLHAMQSGIRMEMDKAGAEGAGADPKHLRVGVNASMSNHGALVKLLIDKNIINEFEYAKMCLFFMEQEVDRYRKLIAERLGIDIDRIQLG